jgi:lysophospholipase L1-like esterase
MTLRFGALLPLALVLGGCLPPEAALTLTPESGSSTGYYRVELQASEEHDLSSVTRVELGGISAIDVRIDGSQRITFLVQGVPEPGSVALVIQLDEGPVRQDDAFTYDPPRDERFTRVAAFGASFTQGVQDGVPNYHGALHNPALQAARQLGAYLPVPALKPGLLPTIELDDLGPPPECVAPDPEEHASAEAAAILGALLDPESGELAFHLGRVDPDVEVRNVAVGGTDLGDMLHGTTDFGLGFMSHLVYDPYGGISDPAPPQIELVEGLDPTLILCTDTYGNDVISAILGNDGIDPADVTDVDELQADIEELVARLAATGAESFLANVPRPSLLPAMPDRRRHTIALLRDEAVADGADPVEAEAEAAEEVDGLIAEIDAIATDINARLEEAAAQEPSVHVVDLSAEFERLVDDGIHVGGQTLTAQRYGGIVTLDGLHFTDTGYGILANIFLDAIDQALGTTTPRVDLEAVIAGDRRSPESLAADGFDAAACED